MSFTSEKKTLNWVELKANAIWEIAGGLSTFTSKFARRENGYSAQVKVGGGKTKAIAVQCKSAKNMGDNQPLILVPSEILRTWETMGVDYKTKDGMFRSRPDGGHPRNDLRAGWCLFPAGDSRITIWAQNIADAVRCLEGGE